MLDKTVRVILGILAIPVILIITILPLALAIALGIWIYSILAAGT